MSPRLLPLALVLLAFPAAAEPASGVNAGLTLAIGGAGLELTYEIPQACASLNFLNDDIQPRAATELRKDWTPLDDCAEVDGKEIRRTRASCTRLRIAVPATTRNLDRVYPWAYPVGGGLFAHMSAYAVAPSCGPVQWTFAVPGGTVVANGEIAAGQAQRAADAPAINDLPLVFLAQPPGPDADQRIHLDPHLSAGARKFIANSVGAIRKDFATALPGLHVASPYVVVSGRDIVGWRGDVANRTVMRLDFPAAPEAKDEAALAGFLAHEMAHLAQPAKWNDSWQDRGYLLHEGGAEFLRWTAQARLGWLDRQGLKDEMEKAVNECVIAAGDGSWSAIADRKWGRNPYSCGLVFHAVALAARADQRPASLLLRDYYAKAQAGAATDFARALECGERAGCEPSWLPRLAGSEALGAVLADYAGTPGAVLRRATRLSPATEQALALHHMRNLMMADCNGGISFYHRTEGVQIAGGPKCGTLREGMVVVAAEGKPLFAGSAGVLALARSCQTSGRATLGLQDGSSVNLACGRSLRPLPALFEVDVDAALKRLVD